MTNNITREILNKLWEEKRTFYRFKGCKLIDEKNNKSYGTDNPRDDKGEGLCIKMRRSKNGDKDKWTIICAGCYGDGVIAGATIFFKSKLIIPIAETYGNGEFQLVVQKIPPGNEVKIINPDNFKITAMIHPMAVKETLNMLPFGNRKSHMKKIIDDIYITSSIFGGISLILIGILTNFHYYGLMGLILVFLAAIHIYWLMKD